MHPRIDGFENVVTVAHVRMAQHLEFGKIEPGGGAERIGVRRRDMLDVGVCCNLDGLLRGEGAPAPRAKRVARRGKRRQKTSKRIDCSFMVRPLFAHALGARKSVGPEPNCGSTRPQKPEG
jgi:hypothetical protein